MVHAMSDSLVEQTGAWATHRADVTTRSVEAFLALLETSSPEGVSMPAVARRAGISVRTLYRYFPTKDDLRRAASGWLDRGSRLAMEGQQLDRSNVRQFLGHLWQEFATELSAVRVQHSTPEGRAMRVERLPRARQEVERALPSEITGRRRSELVDAFVAVTSSSMFLELVDRMQYEPEQAADLVAGLLETIIATESGRAAGAQKG
jgi:AcrR family transcriptional regulator